MKLPAVGIFFALSGPAFAHVGEHGGLSLAALAAHFFETDHLVFAGLAVAVGLLAFRAGRRAEARAVRRRERSHDPR